MKLCRVLVLHYAAGYLVACVSGWCFLLSFEFCAFHFSQHTCAKVCLHIRIKLPTRSSSRRAVSSAIRRRICECNGWYIYGIKKRANATQCSATTLSGAARCRVGVAFMMGRRSRYYIYIFNEYYMKHWGGAIFLVMVLHSEIWIKLSESKILHLCMCCVIVL